MNDQVKRFVKAYVREVHAGNAAVFAGAGLSIPSGYVSWAELLSEEAAQLGIRLGPHTDLTAVAQYFLNAKNNRHALSQKIYNLGGQAKPNQNHKILARLPIGTYWTVNYDPLIEQALRDAGKVVDVKHSVAQMSQTKEGRSAVVYKMHGDQDHPDDTVLLREDYETYHFKRGAFLTALQGQLVEKTFLFIGLSFADPNLNWVLARLRTEHKSPRTHYAFLRRENPASWSSEEEFIHANNLQQHFVRDLQRYGIEAVLLDEYSDITRVLEMVEHAYRCSSVFVSGSAANYNPWTTDEAQGFLTDLSQALVQERFRVVHGFGKGLGPYVVSGAVERIVRDGLQMSDWLVLRPFPFGQPELYEKYRQEMVSHAGIAVFIFGNRHDGIATGVVREFEIAAEQGLYPLPVGGTGGAAAEVYRRVKEDFQRHFPRASGDFRECFEVLGQPAESPKHYIEPLLGMIREIREGF